jgi:Raf kinase inhibitor-like YbhB/YbcL family protein
MARQSSADWVCLMDGARDNRRTPMYMTSPAYFDGELIPAHFAAAAVDGGRGESIPLGWGGEPHGTRSFTLAMIDHHPIAHGWVHWLVVDIPPSVHELAENASTRASMPAGAIELPNTAGRHAYGGSQPPAGSGVHDYLTAIYALDVTRVGVGPDATWEDVRAAMDGHVLDSATLSGRFGR